MPPALEAGLAAALAEAVGDSTAEHETAHAPEAVAVGSASSEVRQAMSRTQAMHTAQRQALEKEAAERRNQERRGEYEAHEEEWLSRLEDVQERLAAELRQARGETSALRRSLADAVADQFADQPPSPHNALGAGELEAQWLEVLVKVQAAEVAAHERQLRHITLDSSLVGSGPRAAELSVKRAGLRELGRLIEKARLSERMALGPLDR